MSQSSASTEFTIEPVSSQSTVLSAATTVESVDVHAFERRVGRLERLLVMVCKELKIEILPPHELN